jgi:hypothetical protein
MAILSDIRTQERFTGAGEVVSLATRFGEPVQVGQLQCCQVLITIITWECY